MAGRVKELADAGFPFGAIADELGVDRNTVTAAWRHWHESRGQAAPDGRARRKALRLAAAGATPTSQPEGGTPNVTAPDATPLDRSASSRPE